MRPLPVLCLLLTLLPAGPETGNGGRDDNALTISPDHPVGAAQASYGLERFQDNAGRSNNKEFVAQTNLTLQTSDNGFPRNLQTGFRYSRRNNDRYYGYRDGFPRVNGQYAPLSSIPGGDQASLTGPLFPGSPRWAFPRPRPRAQ